MITEINCMTVILERIPKFRHAWDEYIASWNVDIPRGLCNDLMEFANFVINLFKQNNDDELKDVFDIMEYLINDSSDQVENIIATCFLENLVNAVARDEIDGYLLKKLLGKKSLEACLSYDKYMGSYTEGLWETEIESRINILYKRVKKRILKLSRREGADR